MAEYFLTNRIYVVNASVWRYCNRVGTNLATRDHRLELVQNADVRNAVRQVLPDLPAAPCYLLLCLTQTGLGVWYQRLETGFAAGGILVQSGASDSAALSRRLSHRQSKRLYSRLRTYRRATTRMPWWQWGTEFPTWTAMGMSMGTTCVRSAGVWPVPEWAAVPAAGRRIWTQTGTWTWPTLANSSHSGHSAVGCLLAHDLRD